MRVNCWRSWQWQNDCYSWADATADGAEPGKVWFPPTETVVKWIYVKNVKFNVTPSATTNTTKRHTSWRASWVCCGISFLSGNLLLSLISRSIINTHALRLIIRQPVWCPSSSAPWPPCSRRVDIWSTTNRCCRIRHRWRSYCRHRTVFAIQWAHL